MSPANSQRELDLQILAAGGYTGWWDHTGQPAPWPDDIFDPDTDWRPDNTQLVNLKPDQQPF